jgi:hypothetical protein
METAAKEGNAACFVCSKLIGDFLTLVYDKNRNPHPVHSMGNCEQKAKEELGVSEEISD